MALDVKVIIDMAKTYGTLGFGYPLILVENAETAVAYKEFTDISEVTSGGYKDTTTAYKAAQLMFLQEHRPEKIAICSTTDTATEWLNVTNNLAKEWRQLVVVSDGGTASAPASIAAAIEAANEKKMYFANVDLPDDITSVTAVEGVTEYNRVVLFYYTATEDVPCPVAALVGEIGGLTPGSYTVNNLTLVGLEPLELSQTEIDAIHKVGGITFILSAGDGVCSEGIVASGEYIDNVDGNDYIEQNLAYKTQKVFNNNLKVPYTNVGIGLLEAAAIEVMQDAVNLGIVEDYSVTYALREQTTAEDRAARKYFGGSVKFSTQGAIHNIEIYCEATV